MKIAIPLANGRLCAHFGHCETFSLLDVDERGQHVTRRVDVPAPAHEPGVLPAWLAEQGVTTVIAGGMGLRARDIFCAHGIEVLVGAPAASPEDLARDYLGGTLRHGQNACDH